MKSKPFFKVLYWVLMVLLVGGLVLICSNFYIDPINDIGFVLIMLVSLLLMISLIIALSIFVYKDTRKRGMDQWMWMTIVVFLPNLMGLIIYLIVRNNSKKQDYECSNCGEKINDDFNICPYCGKTLYEECQNCGEKVQLDWKTCPYCSRKINE